MLDRSTDGGVYDAVTGKQCRYGAWYLRRVLWRKMGLTEEIKQPGVRDSDEAFERVTGQKLLYAADHQALEAIRPKQEVCTLYAAKDFYKRLKTNNKSIPKWLHGCEAMIARDDQERRATKTAVHGSELWRKKRVSNAHSILHLRLKPPPHFHPRSLKEHHLKLRSIDGTRGTGYVEAKADVSDGDPHLSSWCYNTLVKLQSASNQGRWCWFLDWKQVFVVPFLCV